MIKTIFIFKYDFLEDFKHIILTFYRNKNKINEKIKPYTQERPLLLVATSEKEKKMRK